MSILVLSQKIVKDKVKNNLINDDISIDTHTHFVEQAFNKPYPGMECKCTTMKEI